MRLFIALTLGVLASLGVHILCTRRTDLNWFSVKIRVLKNVLRRNQLAIPVVFVGILYITHWPIVALAIAMLVASIPGIGRKPIQSRNEQALIDAIATWTEQLRDTLAGSHGLEQAIVATSVHAPVELRHEVKKLASYIGYGSLEDGLRKFGDAVNNSTADFVVAALITSSQHQARDVGQLLSQIADCARDESKMRSRVWVSRARTRSAVKIIASVITLFFLGLLVFNRRYLEPYSSIEGQFVLASILVLIAFSLSLMQSMSRIAEPDRFVRRRASNNL